MDYKNHQIEVSVRCVKQFIDRRIPGTYPPVRHYVSRTIGGRVTVENLVFVLLLLIYLVPVWAFPYFVTCDGPAHVDNAAALRNYLQGGNTLLHQYYTLNLRLVPNWFTNVILAGLMYVISPITADKILISLYILLLPLSIRYALSAISRESTYLSVLTFPLIYNHILHYGFYNFLFSVSVFFFVIGYWLRNCTNLKPRKIFCLTSLILLLYFSHVVAYVVLVATLPILAFSLSIDATGLSYRSVSSVLQDGWRVFQNRIWIPVLISLVPGIFLIARFAFQQLTSSPSWPNYDWHFFLWPLYGFTAITTRSRHLLMSFSVSLLFIILMFYSIMNRAARQKVLLGNGLVSAVAVTCALYVVSPERMSGWIIIAPRFVFFALLLSILFFATQKFSQRGKSIIIAAAAGIALLQITLNLPVYAQINDEAAEYLSATKEIEQNSTLLALCIATEGCGRAGYRYLKIFPFRHLSGYISAQPNLVNLYINDPHTDFFPIRYRDGLDAYPYVGRKIADYARETEGRIDYVLLWHDSDALPDDDYLMPIFNWLFENYQLVFTSAGRRLDVYQRKDLT